MVSAQIDTQVLKEFRLERTLDEDPKQKSAILLGTIQNGDVQSQAILILEKTHFSELFYARMSAEASRIEDSEGGQTHAEQVDTLARRDVFSAVKSLGQNDIYVWLLAWLSKGQNDGQDDADVKLTLIHPATQTHIEKYSAQRKVVVSETPQMYANKVLPWIMSFPPSRIQWVYNILEHRKEAETILYENSDPDSGFIIVPDLKWDQKTGSSLYIQAIVHNKSLRSLRDLTATHVALLLDIRDQASQIAFKKYGLEGRIKGSAEGNVRCFLHYQPSYYHLHVHVLAASYVSHPGAIVGQAHLLDDVVDLLQMGVDFKERTLTYALGTNNKLLEVLDL